MTRAARLCTRSLHRAYYRDRVDNTPELLGPALVVPTIRVSRSCLCCNRVFIASTKFLRLCPNCRRLATTVHTPQMEGW